MDYSSWGIQSVVIPNPDLKPEKSVNYEIGTSLDFKNLSGVGDRFTARASVFYDDVKDFINVEVEPDNSGSLPVFTYRAKNLGHVVNKGIELSASYVIDSFKDLCAPERHLPKARNKKSFEYFARRSR